MPMESCLVHSIPLHTSKSYMGRCQGFLYKATFFFFFNVDLNQLYPNHFFYPTAHTENHYCFQIMVSFAAIAKLQCFSTLCRIHLKFPLKSIGFISTFYHFCEINTLHAAKLVFVFDFFFTSIYLISYYKLYKNS